MQKVKRHFPLVVVIGILFLTGVTFFHAFSETKLGNVVSAEEDEHESDLEKDSEDSHDSDSLKEDDDEEDNDEDESYDKEDADTEDEDEDEDVDESADEDDQKQEMNTIRTEATIQQRIQTQEGDDEDENDGENEDDDASDIEEEISDFKQEMSKIEARVATISDSQLVEIFTASLNEIRNLVSQLDGTASSNQQEALVEVIDHKIERLDKIMKMDEEDEDEQETDDNDDEGENIARAYKNAANQFVYASKAIEETETEDDESEIGQQVKVVAQSQNELQIRVESAMDDVNEQSEFAKFFIGPKYESLNDIQSAIEQNQNRIRVITELENQVTDPLVKLVLQNQITSLEQQNTQLQAFLTENQGGFSLFGWLTKMFS